MCSACHDYGPDPHKEFIRGGVDPDDFDKEVNYQTRTGKRNKPKSKRPGCPGNEGKAHIYVWTSEFEIEDPFYKFYGFAKRERKACIGCDKGHKGFTPSRLTAEYCKKFDVPATRRWVSPENDDEKFKAFRQRYIAKYGYGDWFW